MISILSIAKPIKKDQRFFLKLLSLMLLVMLALLVVGPKVSALVCPGDPAAFPKSTGGRCSGRGYYTNMDANLDLYSGTINWSWPQGHRTTDSQPINSGADFESIIKNDLFNRGNIAACDPKNYNCTENQGTMLGASLIINMMLGKNGPDFGTNSGSPQAGINYARLRFDEWKAIVDSYDAAGQVDFKVKNVQLPNNRPDSFTVGNGKDVAFLIQSDPPGSTTEAIIFSDKGGKPIFEINKRCGNIFGDSKPLTLIDTNASFNLGATSRTTLNDQEAPTSVTFLNTVNTTLSGTNGVIEPSTTRKFYIVDTNGNQKPVPGIQPSINDTNRRFAAATSAYSYTDTVNISPTLLTSTDKICTLIIIADGNGMTNSAGDVVTSGGSTQTNGGAQCDSIVAKPYAQVYGGDVSAGGGVAAVDMTQGVLICNPSSSALTSSFPLDNPSAAVVSWNRESTDPTALWTGGGGEYSVRATAAIFDFASNYGISSGTGRPVSLSFANTATDVTKGSYGGHFDSAPDGNCDPALMSSTDFSGAVGRTLTSLMAAVGGNTITGSQTIFVKGDIYVDSNEVYGSAGAYGSISSIPSFKVVSLGGNMYVQPGVTQLDGAYYALPDKNGNGGIIYTCANGGSPVKDGANFSTCSNQLIVNGSFVAKQVQLLRSYGSLRNSKNDVDVFDSATPASNHAGEVFNYDPEAWINSGTTIPVTTYESATNLPPVL
jgi:hypothetical protein